MPQKRFVFLSQLHAVHWFGQFSITLLQKLRGLSVLTVLVLSGERRVLDNSLGLFTSVAILLYS